MPDVETMVKSAKAGWINRIFKDRSMSSIIVSAYLKKHNLNVNMLLKCHFETERELKFHLMPSFYKEVFIAYYKCQYWKNISIVSSYEFMSQMIWCNNMFKCKGKCLHYDNWLSSNILHVKDLFNENGTFMTEHELLDKLQNKTNWITEYLTVKNTVNRIAIRYNIDTTQQKYVNIKNIVHPVVKTNTQTFPTKNKKTSFFYKILVDKKFTRTYMEHKWQKELNIEIDRIFWTKIYKRLCIDIFDRKLCEFRYKLLHNILCCNEKLSLWKIRDSNKCNNCEEKGNIKHMLFTCKDVDRIWDSVGKALQVKIQWKHLVIGFDDCVIVNRFRNIMMSIIMYSIYVHFYCKEKCPALKFMVKTYILRYFSIIKHMKSMETYFKLYEKFVHNMYVH